MYNEQVEKNLICARITSVLMNWQHESQTVVNAWEDEMESSEMKIEREDKI